ncbi:hypothetical protein QBC34DRAFT_303082 [Podospora aff. communis PSN243]|uniref:Pyridoxamine 5'-phosphate oxidase N-terminal domain-containing protein n=1 Tax=Podospora aff. communis PSN243 TaxID=3040156 RepID=A0AAV9GGB0_9PEZI|nr:hypothetical protein QBC34DRAFT_303082 [Podospora aff. communis PSN243]
MEHQIPLNHEASAGDTHLQTTAELPAEVVQCLENARFLHLATCIDNIPHVSLMNYTYLPTSPFSSAPVIVMTTNPASKKMNNLVANPNVSLLVHDWVSHRPSTTTARRLSGSGRISPGPGPEPRGPQSSLATLLFNLNSSAVSSISATINGVARLVEHGSEEESFYRARHLENNTFENESPTNFFRRESVAPGEQEREGAWFVAGEDVRVVVVGIRDVRIADWKGAVQDWVIVPEAESGNPLGVNGINGVR